MPRNVGLMFSAKYGLFIHAGLEMTAGPAPSQLAEATRGSAPRPGHAHTPLCLIIDEDASIRHFVALVLHGIGVDSEEFAGSHGLPTVLARRVPDLIFLDIGLESAPAMKCLATLGSSGYRGHVQLTGSRGQAVLEHVKSVGEQHGLQMLPVLKKPFETAVILKIAQSLKLGEPPSIAGRVDLSEALSRGWIEFWYQPKIDLRRKQLVGMEAVARARHPELGVLMPAAFLPGATQSDLKTLSELALSRGLQSALAFAELGASLHLAVNVHASVLDKIAIAEIVADHRAQHKGASGIIIDIAEDQIITELGLAVTMAEKLKPHGVVLAVDHFGRGYSALSRVKEMPFREIKLHRDFVTGLGSDKVNASLCKAVIEFAHNKGATATAIGIERASDALALVGLGCDLGQGFLFGQAMPEKRFVALLRQRAGVAKR